jgi:hypothetical protein
VINERDRMHPHLSREAIVRDVETTRYGRNYAGQRGKITPVDRAPKRGLPRATWSVWRTAETRCPSSRRRYIKWKTGIEEGYSRL